MSAATAAPTIAALDYIEGVLDGSIVTGRLVRLAIDRHLDDLEHGHERGLHFDTDAAIRACEFFPRFCRHSEGEWAGKPFHLEPWEAFIVWCLFGWMKADGTRRFNEALVELGKKNGKSPFAAAIGLYLLVADGEAGPKIYSAATKRDQASIVWEHARRMVKQSPKLRTRLRALQHAITYEAIWGTFKALGSDSGTQDGPNVHGAILDELHAHKNDTMYVQMKQGMAARLQPLLFMITTAADKRTLTIYDTIHSLAVSILEGRVEMDHFFAYIAALDEGDDWQNDESCWIKANPNLGISVNIESLRQEVAKVEHAPSLAAGVARLRFNVRTESSNPFLQLKAWDDLDVMNNEEELRGLTGWAGLDMSSTTDLSALVIVFPGWPVPRDTEAEQLDLEELSDQEKALVASEQEDQVQRYRYLVRLWVPKENVAERELRDHVPYRAWVDAGWIKATPGNVVDYDTVRRDIITLAGRIGMEEIAVDRWNTEQLQQQLNGEGLTAFPHGQGTVSMTGPTKAFQRAVLRRLLIRDNNPVMRWALGNLVVTQDASENYRPDKEKSVERIDPMVALIMAFGRAIVQEVQKPSVYETRGAIIIGDQDGDMDDGWSYNFDDGDDW